MGEKKIVKALDLAVSKMKKGEKCIIVADPEYCALGSEFALYPYNCPPDQPTTFIVELLNFYDKAKGKWDYTH